MRWLWWIGITAFAWYLAFTVPRRSYPHSSRFNQPRVTRGKTNQVLRTVRIVLSFSFAILLSIVLITAFVINLLRD